MPTLGPERRVVKYLAARHDELHGSARQNRSARDKRRLALHATLLAEAAPNRRAFHVDDGRIESEGERHSAFDAT